MLSLGGSIAGRRGRGSYEKWQRVSKQGVVDVEAEESISCFRDGAGLVGYTILPEKHPVEELERDARSDEAGSARARILDVKGNTHHSMVGVEDSRSVMSTWRDTAVAHPGMIAKRESEVPIQETDIVSRKR
ncbi:hypothetical protein CC2G_013365 [Coprinopsis cinerea AmutBmut pab1-1]|nr:hypothetical protein CC2G_013365 [Coprinopsis cinerea AmutBmut pab1-1]